jgi:hypothetical protein
LVTRGGGGGRRSDGPGFYFGDQFIAPVIYERRFRFPELPEYATMRHGHLLQRVLNLSCIALALVVLTRN